MHCKGCVVGDMNYEVSFTNCKQLALIETIEQFLKRSNMLVRQEELTFHVKEQGIKELYDFCVDHAVEMDSIKGIGYLILKHNSFRVSDFILKLILVNKDLTIEQRIRIFYWKHKQVDNEYIDDFLKSLNESYSEITIKGKRPVFKNTEYNLKLIEILDQKNYISKFDFEEKGIRISTYKKDNDS